MKKIIESLDILLITINEHPEHARYIVYTYHDTGYIKVNFKNIDMKPRQK